MKKEKEYRWFKKNLSHIPVENEEKIFKKYKYLIKFALKLIKPPQYMEDDLISIGYYSLIYKIRYLAYIKPTLKEKNIYEKNFILRDIKGRMIRKLNRELEKNATVIRLDNDNNDDDYYKKESMLQLSKKSATYSIKSCERSNGRMVVKEITPCYGESPEKLTELNITVEKINKLLLNLPQKKQGIIKKYFGLDGLCARNQRLIGEEYGIDSDTVSWHFKQGLKTIKKQYEENGK